MSEKPRKIIQNDLSQKTQSQLYPLLNSSVPFIAHTAASLLTTTPPLPLLQNPQICLESLLETDLVTLVSMHPSVIPSLKYTISHTRHRTAGMIRVSKYLVLQNHEYYIEEIREWAGQVSRCEELQYKISDPLETLVSGTSTAKPYLDRLECRTIPLHVFTLSYLILDCADPKLQSVFLEKLHGLMKEYVDLDVVTATFPVVCVIQVMSERKRQSREYMIAKEIFELCSAATTVVEYRQETGVFDSVVSQIFKGMHPTLPNAKARLIASTKSILALEPPPDNNISTLLPVYMWLLKKDASSASRILTLLVNQGPYSVSAVLTLLTSLSSPLSVKLVIDLYKKHPRLYPKAKQFVLQSKHSVVHARRVLEFDGARAFDFLAVCESALRDFPVQVMCCVNAAVGVVEAMKLYEMYVSRIKLDSVRLLVLEFYGKCASSSNQEFREMIVGFLQIEKWKGCEAAVMDALAQHATYFPADLVQLTVRYETARLLESAMQKEINEMRRAVFKGLASNTQTKGKSFHPILDIFTGTDSAEFLLRTPIGDPIAGVYAWTQYFSTQTCDFNSLFPLDSDASIACATGWVLHTESNSDVLVEKLMECTPRDLVCWCVTSVLSLIAEPLLLKRISTFLHNHPCVYSVAGIAKLLHLTNTQTNAQSNAQSNAQFNTQTNAQFNAQSNAQFNAQFNAQSNTQSLVTDPSLVAGLLQLYASNSNLSLLDTVFNNAVDALIKDTATPGQVYVIGVAIKHSYTHSCISNTILSNKITSLITSLGTLVKPTRAQQALYTACLSSWFYLASPSLDDILSASTLIWKRVAICLALPYLIGSVCILTPRPVIVHNEQVVELLRSFVKSSDALVSRTAAWTLGPFLCTQTDSDYSRLSKESHVRQFYEAISNAKECNVLLDAGIAVSAFPVADWTRQLENTYRYSPVKTLLFAMKHCTRFFVSKITAIVAEPLLGGFSEFLYLTGITGVLAVNQTTFILHVLTVLLENTASFPQHVPRFLDILASHTHNRESLEVLTDFVKRSTDHEISRRLCEIIAKDDKASRKLAADLSDSPIHATAHCTLFPTLETFKMLLATTTNLDSFRVISTHVLQGICKSNAFEWVSGVLDVCITNPPLLVSIINVLVPCMVYSVWQGATGLCEGLGFEPLVDAVGKSHFGDGIVKRFCVLCRLIPGHNGRAIRAFLRGIWRNGGHVDLDVMLDFV